MDRQKLRKEMSKVCAYSSRKCYNHTLKLRNRFALTLFGYAIVAGWVLTPCEQNGSLDKRTQPPQHLPLPFGEGIAIWEHNYFSKMVKLYIDSTTLQIASW